MPTEAEQAYLDSTDATRAKRMKWFRDARFGMFIHWGLYAQLGRHEWAMWHERIPLGEYEPLADAWKPKPRAAREWAALAKKAGMKYMVMTTKHHEGFLLWDSKMTDYNAARRGPGRDLVREYVDACRAYGLKIGFYYSLMDWHHPDGAACLTDEAARRRFLDFTQGCVRELMSNYGRIDILWYDVSWPLKSPEAWESYKMNAMARELQPRIIINNRSQLPEDIGTPEEHIKAEETGRDWEACMTFNGSWGFMPTPAEDYHSARKVIEMLRTATAGQGNLLLNVGPKPDGSLPREAVERLADVGKWLRKHGAAAYGPVDRAPIPGTPTWNALGGWSRKGRKLYYWCRQWPGRELAIGGFSPRVRQVRLFPGGKPLPFEQSCDPRHFFSGWGEPTTNDRLVIRGLPPTCPDKIAHTALLEITLKQDPTAQR
ncbi:MAG: alpha-L-fucosidase [Lentisphaerae bacterium]|nr:alpha-L-fucosidase [Lentisphaerota bacterium]